MRRVVTGPWVNIVYESQCFGEPQKNLLFHRPHCQRLGLWGMELGLGGVVFKEDVIL